MPVEVEVRDLAELRAVLPLKPEVVMLDNFTDDLIQVAIKEIKAQAPNTRVEVSGGITETRFPALRKLGVTAVSMGALTTQAQNVDISMRLSLYGAC
jgi:nicotinate-nucleotide pyrophosphorylase (carboxylating)